MCGSFGKDLFLSMWHLYFVWAFWSQVASPHEFLFTHPKLWSNHVFSQPWGGGCLTLPSLRRDLEAAFPAENFGVRSFQFYPRAVFRCFDMCIYVRMYVCMYVSIYIYLYIRASRFQHTNIHSYIHTYIHTYVVVFCATLYGSYVWFLKNNLGVRRVPGFPFNLVE